VYNFLIKKQLKNTQCFKNAFLAKKISAPQKIFRQIFWGGGGWQKVMFYCFINVWALNKNLFLTNKFEVCLFPQTLFFKENYLFSKNICKYGCFQMIAERAEERVPPRKSPNAHCAKKRRSFSNNE
jgi:hypothetical protein